MLMLFPSDVLRPRRVDDHFAVEAAAARELDLEVALVDHDALAGGGVADQATARVRGDGATVAVYRGWMLSSARYAELARALADRGVRLRTTAEQYRSAHELPGWYGALTTVTPESVWTSTTDRAAFDVAREDLGTGSAVLRDYTKSMKHYWDEAMFIPELADADAAWGVARRFAELREHVQGGFVLRRFEAFTSTEVRTWWVHGRCVLVGPHPDDPAGPVPEVDLAAVAPLIVSLDLPFVTVDLARRADGVWRVIEIGDGQVSDRPVTVEAATLLASLVS